MKKRIIISTFLIMICLLTGNCYARAGGGSGSGSSGGGGSSSSSSSPSYYHDHYYYGRRSYNPVSSIVSVGLFIGTIYGVYAFQRRYKANKLHQRAKKQLAILDDQRRGKKELLFNTRSLGASRFKDTKKIFDREFI